MSEITKEIFIPEITGALASVAADGRVNTVKKEWVTPASALVWPSLFTPRTQKSKDGEEYSAYSATLVFPKKTSVKAMANLKALQTHILKTDFPGGKDIPAADRRSPVKDGDADFLKQMEQLGEQKALGAPEDVLAEAESRIRYYNQGNYYISANPKNPPLLQDAKGNPLSEADLYSGAIVCGVFSAYGMKANKDLKSPSRIVFTLAGIVKLADAPKMTLGRGRAPVNLMEAMGIVPEIEDDSDVDSLLDSMA